MNSDEKVEILIRLIADTQGAEQVNQALEKTETDITSLSPKTQDHVKNLQKTAEAADKAELSHRALGAGLRQLGPQAAEAGHLLVTGFANPVTAGFILSAAAIGYLNREMELARKNADSLAENWAKLAQSNADIRRQSIDSANAFLEQLAAIQKEQTSMQSELDKTIAKLQEEGRVAQEVAKIFGGDQAKAGLDATAQKLAAMQLTLNEAVAAHKRLVEETDRASTAARSDRGKEYVDTQTKHLADLQKQLSKAYLDQKDAQTALADMAGDGAEASAARALQTMKEEEATKKIADYQRQIKQVSEAVAASQEKTKNLADAEARAKAAELENEKIRQTLPGQIKALQTQYQHDTSLDVLKRSPIAQTVSAGADALAAIRLQGGRATQDQLAATRQLAVLLDSIHANNATMVNLIEKSQGNVNALAQRVNQIENRQASLLNQPR